MARRGHSSQDKIRRSGPKSAAVALVPSRSGLLEFQALSDFEFRAPNASSQGAQKGRRKGRYLTSSSQFANQAILPNRQNFKVLAAKRSIDCLDPARWKDTDFSGKRVLFLLPSQALGNNVCIALFLQAFKEQSRPRVLGVFCAQASSDIFARIEKLRIYSLWIDTKALKTWDYVIDLGHLEARRNIEFWPVDMEAELLDAFAVPPSQTFAIQARTLAVTGRLRIGIFPLASSPLRTLPVRSILAVMEKLAVTCDITLCLNDTQRQGQLFLRDIEGRIPSNAEIVEGFGSIGGLITAIEAFDYVIMADSGPAHMSKLGAVPGMAVYTSAPGAVLQGRFENLAIWTVPYKGAFCAAPCGLAKLRQSADGRVGCMGSLELPVSALPDVPGRQDAGQVDHFAANPVPCVRFLQDQPEDLVAAIWQDLANRGWTPDLGGAA